MATKQEGAPSTSSGTSSDDGQTAGQKKADRMARLRNLHLRRNEARKLNHQEVVEEDKRKKLPSNWEARKRRQEWEDAEEEKRKQCKEAGEEYDRVKLLDIQADQAERWDRMKQKKHNPDVGFSDFAQATYRQYQRLTKQMKPDMTSYERQKTQLGEAVYGEGGTTNMYDHKDTKEGIDRMVDDLEKQVEKRSKYSRRRAYDEDEDIDYINERNKNFNKKLERFYGQYTTEIKQNLERGTAV